LDTRRRSSAEPNPLLSFLIDYWQRHRHPTNAVLHLIGVPMAVAGLYELVAGHPFKAVMLLSFGYLLQYLGHRAQGNEVGEVTLVKSIWRRLTGAKGAQR